MSLWGKWEKVVDRYVCVFFRRCKKGGYIFFFVREKSNGIRL